CAGNQYCSALVAPVEPAVLSEPWVPVQPFKNSGYTVLGESPKYFRSSWNHGQQSRPDELGSSEPHVFERPRGTVRCANFLRSQSDQRVVLRNVVESGQAQHYVWR